MKFQTAAVDACLSCPDWCLTSASQQKLDAIGACWLRGYGC